MGRTHDLIEDAVDVLISGDPVLFEGPPGSGKSEASRGPIVDGVAKELGVPSADVKYCDIRLAYMDPIDMKGLPTINFEEGVTTWLTPDIFPKTGPAIINLEEVLNCNRALHYALYELLAEGRIGDYELPENVFVMGTGNRKIDGCGVTKLPAGLRDRFVNFEWVLDPNDWRFWAGKNKIHYKFITMTNYLEDFITEFDGTVAEAGKTSTARSLTRLARAYEARGFDKLIGTPAGESKLMRIASGYLGEVDASRAVGFLSLFDKLIPINTILADPKNAETPSDYDVDVLYALTASLSRKANEDNIGAILTYIDRLPRTFGAVFGIDLPNLNDLGADKTREFIKWLTKKDNPLNT